MHKSETILLQINNRAGDQYAQFHFQYELDNKFNSLSAQIEDLEGKPIRKLKKSEIKHSNANYSMLYSDDYRASFSLRHNEYPYRIRVNTENSYSEYLSIDNWIPVHFYKVPTQDAVLLLKIPEEYKIIHREQFTPPPVIETHNGLRTYKWTTNYRNIIREEVYSPPLEVLLPGVFIYPEEFKYGVPGSFKTWEEFGQWSYTLNENLDQLNPSEARQVALLTSDISDDIEKVRVLYHYLQDNTRYINVSIDIGGYKPYPAEYVCQNKYGDCKALTMYMRALLKEAGINSYYTLVYSDDKNIPLSPNFPEQHFNHVILYVPLEKDTLWLENTNKHNPMAYVHSYIQDRYALIVDDQNSRLVKIPAYSVSDIRNDRNIKLQIDGKGNAEMDLQIIARGAFFETLKDFNNSLNEHSKKEAINELFHFSSFDILNWEIAEVDRDLEYALFTSKLSLSNYGKRYNNEMVVKLPSLNIPEFETPSKRTLPVQVDYPKYLSDTILLKVPAGYQLNAIPNLTEIQSKYGTYRVEYSEVEGELCFYRTFIFNAGTYGPDEYGDLFRFLEEALKNERENVLVFSK